MNKRSSSFLSARHRQVPDLDFFHVWTPPRYVLSPTAIVTWVATLAATVTETVLTSAPAVAVIVQVPAPIPVTSPV